MIGDSRLLLLRPSWLRSDRRARHAVRRLALVAGFFLGLSALEAHVWNMTRLHVGFASTRRCDVRLDLDLTRLLGSADAYYALTQADPARQDAVLRPLLEQIWPQLHLQADGQPLSGRLVRFRLPQGPRSEFGYVGVGKMTEFLVDVALPEHGTEVWCEPAPELAIEYPIGVTFEIPAQNLNITRWIDVPGPSRKFDYAARLSPGPSAATSVAPVVTLENTLDLTEGEARAMGTLLTAWRYLHLGFRHIVPQGLDHILFVVGLFFLGVSWRKLLTQTTIFTVAHATTLGLSACGIFSLPAWFVEPAIAASIAFIAIENIVRPQLTSGRLVVVFVFGLIHGLGFAGSLAEVGLPPNEFWVALVSFNFGVDFGQLAVLALCFLAVGWFRQRTWFRPRIVVPACSLVGGIGAIWAIQRIAHFISLT